MPGGRTPGVGRRPHVAIVGAGPIGIEAALAAAEHGMPFTVYEAATHVAGHVRDWGHVRMFTPWELNVSRRLRALLGDAAPDGDSIPSGADAVERLYAPAAAREPLASSVRLGTRVDAVGRDGLLKHDEIGTGARARRRFRLLVTGPGGEESIEHADVVLDCSGTYGNPNALGHGGIPAPGERALDGRIARRIPDFRAEPRAWAGRTILVTGAGHSAQTAAVELAELARGAAGTRVIWAVRDAAPDWDAVPGDPLPARAALAASAEDFARGASPDVEVLPGRVVEALAARGDGAVDVTLRNGVPETVTVERILALNGGVGDFSIYRQLQVHECYATAGPMRLAAALLGAAGGDCLAQESHGPETLVNPEPGFFILGAKSYGRNSRFLLRIGRQQVDDVFGSLLS